jgi:hypothetical protein
MTVIILVQAFLAWVIEEGYLIKDDTPVRDVISLINYYQLSDQII